MAREKEWSTFPQLKDDLLMGQPDRKYFYYTAECRGQSRALLMAEREEGCSLWWVVLFGEKLFSTCRLSQVGHLNMTSSSFTWQSDKCHFHRPKEQFPGQSGR